LQQFDLKSSSKNYLRPLFHLPEVVFYSHGKLALHRTSRGVLGLSKEPTTRFAGGRSGLFIGPALCQVVCQRFGLHETTQWANITVQNRMGGVPELP
jgi:hypothetical protein